MNIRGLTNSIWGRQSSTYEQIRNIFYKAEDVKTTCSKKTNEISKKEEGEQINKRPSEFRSNHMSRKKTSLFGYQERVFYFDGNMKEVDIAKDIFYTLCNFICLAVDEAGKYNIERIRLLHSVECNNGVERNIFRIKNYYNLTERTKGQIYNSSYIFFELASKSVSENTFNKNKYKDKLSMDVVSLKEYHAFILGIRAADKEGAMMQSSEYKNTETRQEKVQSIVPIEFEDTTQQGWESWSKNVQSAIFNNYIR